MDPTLLLTLLASLIICFFGFSAGWWSRSMYKLCPGCAKLVNKDATICKHCRTDLSIPKSH